MGWGKLGSGGLGSGRLGSGKLGSGVIGIGKVGVGELGSGRLGSRELGSRELGSGVGVLDCDTDPPDPHRFSSCRSPLHFTLFSSNCPRIKSSLHQVCLRQFVMYPNISPYLPHTPTHFSTPSTLTPYTLSHIAPHFFMPPHISPYLLPHPHTSP